MKKFVKTIVFKIGIDVLGFPKFHNHHLIFEKPFSNCLYFKAFSKK